MHFLSKHPLVAKMWHQSLKSVIFAHFLVFTKRFWSKTKQIRKWKWYSPLYGSKLEFPPPHYNFGIVHCQRKILTFEVYSRSYLSREHPLRWCPVWTDSLSLPSLSLLLATNILKDIKALQQIQDYFRLSGLWLE